ncbi:hypothetical protein MK280_01900, partial [Myxococcota bacterium]|nr:hypothetical protein [Myxococcota bacterium]
LPADATGVDLAHALGEIHDEPGLQRQLGEGARQALESEHAWGLIGKRTLEYVEQILGEDVTSSARDGDSHSG